MVSSYLKYSTTATKPCTLSASSAPAAGFMAYHLTSVVLVQGVNCNHTVTSNTESLRDVFTTTSYVCYILYLPNALLVLAIICILCSAIVHCVNPAFFIGKGTVRQSISVVCRAIESMHACTIIFLCIT